MSLKSRHPGVILFFFASVLVVTMSTRHPGTSLLSFILAFLFRIRLTGLRRAIRSLAYLVPMTLLMILFNSLFNDRGLTVLLILGSWRLTLESLFYGLVSGLVLSSVMLWFQSYSDLMESGRFLALLGNRLPVISMMVAMIFRLIPQTLSHGRQIDLGRRALTGEPKRRVKLGGAIRMISILMAWSMENAIETADAMRAKAFDAGRRRAYGRLRWSSGDFVLMAVNTFLLVITALGGLLGGSAFLYYPMLAFPDRAIQGQALTLWLVAGGFLFALPLLADLTLAASGPLLDSRCRPVGMDPLVAAMMPKDFRGVEG